MDDAQVKFFHLTPGCPGGIRLPGVYGAERFDRRITLGCPFASCMQATHYQIQAIIVQYRHAIEERNSLRLHVNFEQGDIKSEVCISLFIDQIVRRRHF